MVLSVIKIDKIHRENKSYVKTSYMKEGVIIAHAHI